MITKFLARGLTWVALGWSVGGLIATTMHGQTGHAVVFVALSGISAVYLWLLAGEW